MSPNLPPRLAFLSDIRWHRATGTDVPRWGAGTRLPTHASPPVVVLLVDENSCSDADTLAHAVKNLKVGCVIGHRTWGGVTTMYSQRLADGTSISLPSKGWESSFKSPAIENHGVEPDVQVDYPPQAYKLSSDPQLQRAVAEAQARIQAVDP